MAAILSTDETRDFQSFLDSFDRNDVSAADHNGRGFAANTGMRTSAVGAEPAMTARSVHYDNSQARGNVAAAQRWAGWTQAVEHGSHAGEQPTSGWPAQEASPGSASPSPHAYGAPTTHSLHGSTRDQMSTYRSRVQQLPSEPELEEPPTSTPYPNAAPLRKIDPEMLERMAQQARELSDWMKARTEPSNAPPMHSFAPPPPVGSEPPGFRSPKPTRGAALSFDLDQVNDTAHPYYASVYQERPPVVTHRPDGETDPMQAMREAEERAAFARRMSRLAGEDPRLPPVFITHAALTGGPVENAFERIGAQPPPRQSLVASTSSVTPGLKSFKQPHHSPASYSAQQRVASVGKGGFALPKPPARSDNAALNDGLEENDEEDEGHETVREDKDDTPFVPPAQSRRKPAAASAKKKAAPKAAASRSASVPSPSHETLKTTKAATTSSKAAARSTAMDAADDDDYDPSLNPPPFSTPANIPPSPFPPPHKPPRRPRPATQTSSSEKVTAGGSSSRDKDAASGKPALLTAEQKKANHIASEQKRRAAIRQGYETLCSVVPPLRAAVEEFEERVKRLGGGGAGGSSASGRGRKRKSGTSYGTSAGPLSGGIEVGGEKVDGRAGPKSEAVVLSKTVEHLRCQLASRQDMLERLSALYQLAAERGHSIQGGHRVWEEEWDEADVEETEEGGFRDEEGV